MPKQHDRDPALSQTPPLVSGFHTVNDPVGLSFGSFVLRRQTCGQGHFLLPQAGVQPPSFKGPPSTEGFGNTDP